MTVTVQLVHIIPALLSIDGTDSLATLLLCSQLLQQVKMERLPHELLLNI